MWPVRPPARASVHPSLLPSVRPCFRPSVLPSVHPSLLPSFRPLILASFLPSVRPSVGLFNTLKIRKVKFLKVDGGCGLRFRFSRDMMCLPETQCVFQRHNVFSGDTMWLLETMCLLETQCGFRRHNVASRDTMWLPETGCPSHNLTSRSSLELFPPDPN